MKKKLELINKNTKKLQKNTSADDHVCTVNPADLGSSTPYVLTYMSYCDPTPIVTEDKKGSK